jgi:hypothetical protein
MSQPSHTPRPISRVINSVSLVGIVAAIGMAGAVSCLEERHATSAPPQITVPPVTYEPIVIPQPNALQPATVGVAPAPKGPSFAEDLKFLEEHGSIIQLETPEHGVIALSAKYQGRVMTSAVARDAASIGYVNRKFISEGKTGTAFDNYGGEDRFWLGPEGGQYGLYFLKGKPFEIANWQTPAALQVGDWTVAEKSPTSVTLTRTIKLSNYTGTDFELEVKRTVRVLSDKDVLGRLPGVTTLAGVKWVAFESVNQITNKGKHAWSKYSGLLSVWILSQYNPSADANVIVPFERAALGEIVNDRYFGVVPSERLHVFADGGFLTFRCDGQHRSKIGLGAERAKSWLGSYSESTALLTLVSFDKPATAKDYVNSMWEKQKEPYLGDAVNSYNDGPVEPGKAALGGFYELETSSPAAALAPGQSLTHVHRTLHFVGAREKLDPFAKAALGVTLGRIVEVTK